MQSKVNIQADDMGNVVRQSNTNSEYGHVRLTQTRTTFGNGGWVKKSNLSALLQGRLEDLQEIGFESMDSLPGKIIFKEQLEPFSTNDPDRDLKKAGDTGIICCIDGQPIYRKTFFVADVTAQDVSLAHNNGQAIKDANSSDTKADVKVTATPTEAFGMDDGDDNGNITDEVSESVEEVVEEVEETFEL